MRKMPEKKILSVDFQRDKTKWIIVAILSVMLLCVVFYNTVLSSKEPVRKPYIEEQQNAAPGFNISSNVLELLQPAAPAVVLDEAAKEDLIPPLITDLFSFRERAESRRTEVEAVEMEEEDFTLKGTIIDGNHSVAFLNDEVLSINDTINGFTVVEITENRTVLKNSQKEITILQEDKLDVLF